MTALDTLRFAAEGIRRAPLRAALTATGVAVAVTVLALMVGFGAGVQRFVADLLESEDLLSTMKVLSRHDPLWRQAPEGADESPDDPDAGTRPVEDAALAVIAAHPDVGWAVRDVRFLTLAKRADGAGAKARNPWDERVMVLGFWPQALPADAAERLAEGRLPHPDEPDGVVVTREFAKRYAPEGGGSIVGSRIVLDYRRSGAAPADGAPLEPLAVTVTGVLQTRARLVNVLTGFMPGGSGRIVYLPAATADRCAPYAVRGLAEMFAGSDLQLPPGTSSSASVRLRSPAAADAVRAAIEGQGYRALYAGDLLRRVRVLFGVADGILLGLGSVALVVASLGIVNTMLMAVIERTREIGVLKALGARDRTIAWLFWCEAGWLGALGGTGGALLGLALGELASALVNAWYIVPHEGPQGAVDLYVFPAWLWAAAIGLAMGIAWLAALYPARRAARIDPVRALRYE